MTTEMTTTQQVILGLAVVFSVAAVGVVAYDALNEPSSTVAEPAATTTTAAAAEAVPAVAIEASVSELEADGLVFMIEEEKLARDVYLTLADIWGTAIFTNIASAEQTHMDAVLGLIDMYGLEDPVGNNPIGVFQNAELQGMYDDLITTGSESVESALGVGALIEEVDIEDLAIYISATDSSAIIRVYERLLSGSENHLRAFTSQLDAAGVHYEPQVLDAEVYESILSSSNGHEGRGQGRGNGRHGQDA